jgi:hypothetical protein
MSWNAPSRDETFQGTKRTFWLFWPWRSEKVTTNGLKKMRLKGKDFKKGGEALRGKNVIEAYRVKDKEIKRTMK